MNQLKIPVGTSSFREIREEGCVYIDKTELITELLKTSLTKATLITRPRRFGKTLGMSMLAEFFDIRRESAALFAGLKVTENDELCSEWMNRFPVVFLSFRGVDGLTFESALRRLVQSIADLYKEHLYLTESTSINKYDREFFDRIASEHVSIEDLGSSLHRLVRMIHAFYKRPVILLLDEYDVPLAKASDHGYYEQMLDLIRSMMTVLKDNDSLKFAVVTGCLRIAKESIFTGTNNFVSDTITDTRLNEFFGFTQSEVGQLLADTGLQTHAEDLQKWYDGYRFGSCNVYCPWDVMNYVNDLLLDDTAIPQNYWENTSDNSIIRSFLNHTDVNVNEDFERLLAGKSICKPICENLTYNILESSEENLWSLLYFTGYLTKTQNENEKSEPEKKNFHSNDAFTLCIPNLEIMGIFQNSVESWQTERSRSRDRRELFAALWNADAGLLTGMLSDLLFDTISYYDYGENFYHAFLAGLFSNAGYAIDSNREYGLGRPDLVIKDQKNRRAVLIEVKQVQQRADLDAACEAALLQIRDKQYAGRIKHSGYQTVIQLGIAFFEKECLVRSGE